MKKTAVKLFLLISALMVFFAGCNNLLDSNIKDDATKDGKDDVISTSSKAITLKGALAVEGDAAPSGILAMVGGESGRSAVTGGSMHDGYGFTLKATVKNSRDSVNADVNGDHFSITLEAEKDYVFDLALNSSGVCPVLTISKIMFGDTEASPDNIKLKGLSSEEIENTKVCFSPDTSLSGTGKIALEIKTDVDKVKYVGYSFVKSDNAAYSGSGTEEFNADSKATINVTEGAEKGEDPTPIANGIYDFEFSFYDTDPDASAAARPTPLAVTYQKVNVFAGFVTDTWISDGSAYFEADAGKHGDFTVTQAAIEAYKNPKEFYVKGDGGSITSWGDADDYNAGTSIRRPFRTLQQAIDAIIDANDGTSEYTIYVKDTVYPKVYTTDKDGSTLPAPIYKMVDFSELGTTVLNLTIVGVGSDTMLDARYDNSGASCGSVINATTGLSMGQESALNLTLKNLTITGGNQGGLYIDKGRGEKAATVTLEKCTISENTGLGGIYNNCGTVTLKKCNIANNEASSGSGVYCSNGEIVIDETAITSNKFIDTANNNMVRYDQGIQLSNSTLTVKNTLTLGNSIRVGGESTITNGAGNDATIKRDDNVNDFVFVCVDSNATLNLKDLVFEGFSKGKGVWLNDVTSFLKLDGKITGSSEKPLDVYVENSICSEVGKTYVPIILEDTYSSDSKIFVKLEGINDVSSDVLVSPCDADKAKTFDVVYEPTSGGSEYFTVTPAGKLKSAIFTQEVFRTLVPNYATITEYTIPSEYRSVEGEYDVSIGGGVQKYVFAGCDKLKTVTVPKSVIKIGEMAFKGSSNSAAAAFEYVHHIENIIIEEGLTSIESHAFCDCNKLTSITLPSTVTSIGGNAFSGCASLESVTIKASTPPALGDDNPFPNSNTPIIVFVPSDAVSTYKDECEKGTNNLNWKDKVNANQIYAIGDIPATRITLKANTVRIGLNEEFNISDVVVIEPSNTTDTIITASLNPPPTGGAITGVTCADGKLNATENKKKDITVSISVGRFWQTFNLVVYDSDVFDNEAVSYLCESSIDYFEIPYGFTSIEGYNEGNFDHPLFTEHSDLVEITIPETVTSINEYAFSEGGDGTEPIKNVEKITMKGKIPPTITAKTFSYRTRNGGTLKIVVPKGYKTAYEDKWTAIDAGLKIEEEQ